MSEIFISYAKEDRARVVSLALALEAHGWSVFWDRNIPAGRDWRDVIADKLDEAKCIIVIWSETSIRSRWVREEADVGLERGILMPALIDQVPPVLGFRTLQAADLIDWDGQASAPAFCRLIDDIAGLIGSPQREVRPRGQPIEQLTAGQSEAVKQAVPKVLPALPQRPRQRSEAKPAAAVLSQAKTEAEADLSRLEVERATQTIPRKERAAQKRPELQPAEQAMLKTAPRVEPASLKEERAASIRPGPSGESPQASAGRAKTVTGKSDGSRPGRIAWFIGLAALVGLLGIASLVAWQAFRSRPLQHRPTMIVGQLIATLTGHSDGVFDAAFSPDGTRVVTASEDSTARIWDAANGHPIVTLRGHSLLVFAACFSPDGTRVVTASHDRTARIWNAATGEAIAVLRHTDGVWAASFSPDGTRVVTASSDRTARIWDASTGQPIVTLAGHLEGVLDASFSPDGLRVVTASYDNTARIWNAATGQPIAILRGHTGMLHTASFSQDSTSVVTAAEDHTGRIWNAATGKTIAVLTAHRDVVLDACFSPDGTRVVTASSDRTARIWNAATGQPIATLSGHSSEVSRASFSPDSTRVVTASFDKTARIWNAATGQPIATLTGHLGSVFAASFSPDGARVVTASTDKTARIWNGI